MKTRFYVRRSGNERASSCQPYTDRYLPGQTTRNTPIIRAQHVTLTPGTRLGPYDIVALLGAGGMGEVYRARDSRPALSRDVAIKVLSSAAPDDDSRRRFEHEARATGALNHPNILAIYDVGVHDGTLYLVEEFIDGITLREELTRGSLSMRRALDYARAIAQGLAAAHARGIVHRDLKPENVMVTADGRVKLLDFGLAKLQHPDREAPATESGLVTRAVDDSTQSLATRQGTVLGTVSYMSPEQVRGQSLDHRSDIFSFGVVLHEMLGGERPFVGESVPDTQAAILNAEPREFAATRGVPPSLERVVRRCLEKRPDQRFQSASDLAFALDALAWSSGSGTRAPATSALETASSDISLLVGVLRRHPVWTFAAALGLFSIIGLTTLGVVTRTTPRDTSKTDARDTGLTLADYEVAQLTTGGNASRPAVSPDGKYLAYVRQDGREQSLWLQQIASGSDVQIAAAEHGRRIDGVTIGPDSSFVDFARGSGNSRDLWRVPLLGGTPRMVAPTVDSAITWAPDGQHFAFVRGITSLVIANASGQQQREVMAAQQPLVLGSFAVAGIPPVRPAWSPDGRTLALGALDSGVPKLLFVDEDGRNRREATLSSESRDGMAWARSNDLLVVAPPFGAANKQLFRFEPATQRLSRLTSDVSSYSGLSVSANGQTMVSAKEDLKAGVFVADASSLRFSEIVPPTTFSSRAGNFRLTWSRDDLFYMSTTGGPLSVWRMPQTGARRAERIVPGLSVSASDDGTSLLVIGLRSLGTPVGLWRVRTDGTGEQQLDAGQVTGTVQSHDGKTLVFVSQRAGEQQLWALDANAQTARALTTRYVGTTGAAFSPDDRRLAFNARASDNSPILTICDMPSCTNQLDVPIPARWATWTPDGRSVAYTLRDDPFNIFVRSLDTGTTRQLTSFPDDAEITDFAWSADGKRLAVARVFTSSDVVMFKRTQP